MLSEKDLIGAWRLENHYYLDRDGSVSEGPLGADAEGLLIYQEGGHMTASMMRTRFPDGDGTPPPSYLGSSDNYLGYAGRWSVDGGLVWHEVLVGSHPRVVNTRQVREIRLTERGLSLRRRLDGPHQYIVMDWRRA